MPTSTGRRIFWSVVMALAALLLMGLWGFLMASKPLKIISALSPADFGLEYQGVIFKTDDELELQGWWVPKRGGGAAPTLALLHGYPADKGNILPVTAALANDFNLFYFDFRSFGRSQGLFTAGGSKEVADLKAALKFLKSRGVVEVGLWGFSMGAAVALLGASELPEVKAVAAHGSYASLENMLQKLYPLPLLQPVLVLVTEFWGWLIMGAAPVSPAQTAALIPAPIFLIHSRADDVIPFSEAEQIAQNLEGRSRVEFWFYDDLPHGVFPTDYEERLKRFFKQYLK